MTAKEYLEQLAQAAGLADDVKAGLLKVAENEKAAKALEEGVMLRSDYSRQSDALKKEKDDYTKFYKDTLDWRNQKQQEVDAFYKQFEDGGHGNGNGNGNGNGQTVLTVEALSNLEKKFQDEMNRREGVQISLLKDGMRLASQHVYEFKEPLDTEALAKLAVDKQIPLTQAYDEWVKPRRTERQTQEFEAKLKAAREEGAKDALSKHKLPVDTAPREFHPLMDDKTGRAGEMPAAGPARDAWIREQFVKDLNSPTGATSGGTQ